MRVVYTDKHKLHATDEVQVEGRPFATEEVPARAEVILSAVQAAQLGPVSAPTDHGLEPILAVHDAGYVDFLRTAYDEFMRTPADYAREALLPATFPARGWSHRPSSLLGRAGYYLFDLSVPIVEPMTVTRYTV